MEKAQTCWFVLRPNMNQYAYEPRAQLSVSNKDMYTKGQMEVEGKSGSNRHRQTQSWSRKPWGNTSRLQVPTWQRRWKSEQQSWAESILRKSRRTMYGQQIGMVCRGLVALPEHSRSNWRRNRSLRKEMILTETQDISQVWLWSP